MDNNVIAQPVLNNNPDLEEIEAQILNLAPQDSLSLQYKIAKDNLVQAYADLNLVLNFCQGQVEIGKLPIIPKFISHRTQ